MNTKLTLRLDTALIESAKRYSAQRGKSLSRIVADLFEIIDEKTTQESKLPPTVSSLRGILKEKGLDEKDYKRFLAVKYL